MDQEIISSLIELDLIDCSGVITPPFATFDCSHQGFVEPLRRGISRCASERCILTSQSDCYGDPGVVHSPWSLCFLALGLSMWKHSSLVAVAQVRSLTGHLLSSSHYWKGIKCYQPILHIDFTSVPEILYSGTCRERLHERRIRVRNFYEVYNSLSYSTVSIYSTLTSQQGSHMRTEAQPAFGRHLYSGILSGHTYLTLLYQIVPQISRFLDFTISWWID